MSDDRVTAERTTLAAVYADIQARIEELEGSKAGVRARLLELGAGLAGPLRVQVTSTRRLDSDAFTRKYDPVEYPGYYLPGKPNTALAKALNDDSVYVDGPTSVRVVEAD